MGNQSAQGAKKSKPGPTGAAKKKAAGAGKVSRSDTILQTYRLRPETVQWLKFWAEERGESVNGFAQKVLDAVRLYGFVPDQQADELDVDRRAHKYDPLQYQTHMCWKRGQLVEKRKPGFDKTDSRFKER